MRVGKVVVNPQNMKDRAAEISIEVPANRIVKLRGAIISLGAPSNAHDWTCSIYCPVKNKIFVIDVAVLMGIKKFSLTNDGDYNKRSFSYAKTVCDKIFRFCQDVLGINEFDSIIYKLEWGPNGGKRNFDNSNFSRTIAFEFARTFNCEKFVELTFPEHNELHALGAYYNSGFKKSFFLAYDAGCGSTNFLTGGIDKNQVVFSLGYPYQIHFCLSAYLAQKLIPMTSPRKVWELDIAGKVMGHSAYFKALYPNYDEKKYRGVVDILKNSTVVREHKNRNHNITSLYEECPDTEESIMSLTSAMQEAHNECVVDFFYKDDLYKSIKENWDNNLCMSGGSSLNVLTNEIIRKEFGFNVFVPPDPGDSGLSEALLQQYLNDVLGIPPTIIGSETNVPLMDLKSPPSPSKIISLEQLCSLFRKGKIIGFLEGNVEYGPRALGKRSILCDPSYKNMKDKINKNVKNREWYRPFAPVCKLEDAHIYFDRDRFDDLSTMSFAVNVKDEYKEQLSSITHVDGTARLQTVTKEQNPVLYGILNTFGGVLLNTSFNVSGKPILNSLESAMTVLNETELDCVVWYDGENYNLYEKNVDL